MPIPVATTALRRPSPTRSKARLPERRTLMPLGQADTTLSSPHRCTRKAQRSRRPRNDRRGVKGRRWEGLATTEHRPRQSQARLYPIVQGAFSSGSNSASAPGYPPGTPPGGLLKAGDEAVIENGSLRNPPPAVAPLRFPPLPGRSQSRRTQLPGKRLAHPQSLASLRKVG